MTGNNYFLTFTVTYLTAYAVCIFYCNVQKLAASGGLIVGYGTLYHVAQVVELMAAALLGTPAGWARPVMRMGGVHGAGGVEIAVWFLRGCHYIQHTVNICFQLLVRIGLQQVAGTLDGLIDIGVIKRELGGAVVAAVVAACGLGHLGGGVLKVGVSVSLLTLAECQRDGNLAALAYAVTPECIGCHLDLCKRYVTYGITGFIGFLSCRKDKH